MDPVQDADAAPWNYEAIKAEIDRRYSAGRFVALDAGKVIADAATHRDLVTRLQSQGLSPKGMIIVEAGVDYPSSATIFLPSGITATNA